MTPHVDWAGLLPQIFLGGGGLLLLTVASLARRRLPSWFATAFSVAAALGAFGSVIWLWIRVQDPARGAFSTIADTISIDGFAVFLSGVVVVSVLLAAVLASGSLRREGLPVTEFCVLLLLSGAGGVTMASANDLIVLFLGLEVLSIAAYVLAALDLRRATSQEAGLKYFVLGAFASAFFLYGVALLYGATGSTKLAVMADVLAGERPESNGLLLGGMALLLVGLFFKVAAVPFHAWTPDVYEGSPSPAVAYMAAGVKAAGFRRPAAGVRGGLRRRRRRLAAHRVRHRRADGAGGRRPGGRAVRRAAFAGLLLHQPRRFHPRGGRGSG